MYNVAYSNNSKEPYMIKPAFDILWLEIYNHQGKCKLKRAPITTNLKKLWRLMKMKVLCPFPWKVQEYLLGNRRESEIFQAQLMQSLLTSHATGLHLPLQTLYTQQDFPRQPQM